MTANALKLLPGAGPPLPAEAPQPASPVPPIGFDAILVELHRAVELLSRLGQPTTIEALAVGREQIAHLFSISKATVDRWDSSGLLGPVGTKKSGRKLWSLAELKDWAARGMPSRKEWLAMRNARK
jgi:hypothetical protein